jgi:hypothetical protein
MQLWGMADAEEPVMGGGVRIYKRAYPIGNPVKLNGAAKRIGQDVPWDIRAGAGLTHGIDADFFAKWMADNKDSDVVKGGHIFASAKTGDVVAEAKEKIGEKTGLEPLNPNSMPAEFSKVVRTATGG